MRQLRVQQFDGLGEPTCTIIRDIRGSFAFKSYRAWPETRPMKDIVDSVEHPLRQTRPGFLDRLSDDPDGAFGEFYEFVHRALRSGPRELFWLPTADQEDYIQETIVRCWRDDCRALRNYEDRGVPFSVFLMNICRRLIIDAHRRGKNFTFVNTEDDFIDRLPAVDGWLEGRELAAILPKVDRCLRRLDSQCRTLILLAADGARPKEIVRLLELPNEDNKKVSDRLRYCRELLRACLSERENIEIEDLVPSPRKKRT